tara:strand:- start:2687 stop:4690 length:2004 start_codon:yes stop_codon:yes gene_type:complete
MALSNKAKSYISNNFRKKSDKHIAETLKLDISEVQDYIDTLKKPLPLKKKILFYGITLSTPILFFVILELGLRSVNYLGNTDLFVDPNISMDEYLIPNPNFAARYFFYTSVIPNPSIDVFLAEKPENGFRVFAMGGSSAAAYPYGFNGSFSRVVGDVLTDALPDKKVEVVNVGISAINSYTLFDQVDEILAHSPDAIMIYAGHNEFYGALGVGSNENLGAFPGFVRFYLKLQRFKTFLFLRNLIVDSGKWFASIFSGEEPIQGTLMEQMISSRSIELDSPKYELAMIQFESNMSAIIQQFEKKGVPVYFASVASNIKDQAPFVDITDGEQPSALQTYKKAQQIFSVGDFTSAKNKFTLAKDLDGLKFRAPSEINSIIDSLSNTFSNTTYVPVEEFMSEESPEGIIGNNLMLEHLHPNQDGYFAIGKTFSEALLANLHNQGLTQFEVYDWDSYKQKMHLSEYDQRVAWHRVKTLKQGFPFVQKGAITPYQLNYKPISFADSLAFETVQNSKGWDRAKIELAVSYEKSNQPEKALEEYLGLSRDQPWNDSPYTFAAKILLNQNDLEGAEPLLRKAYEITKKETYVNKMLGAIELNKGNVKEAIILLEESRALNQNDPQMLFNLSGAYGTDQQFEKALEIADQVNRISPNFPGLQAWRQQLNQIIQSKKR